MDGAEPGSDSDLVLVVVIVMSFREASRTYVVVDSARAIGCFAFAAGGINITTAPGLFAETCRTRSQSPSFWLLAVDRSYQGKGLGRALFRDGAKQFVNADAALGIRGLIVHAISDDARAFYLALGFVPSPPEPMTLMVTLAELRASLNLLHAMIPGLLAILLRAAISAPEPRYQELVVPMDLAAGLP